MGQNIVLSSVREGMRFRLCVFFWVSAAALSLALMGCCEEEMETAPSTSDTAKPTEKPADDKKAAEAPEAAKQPEKKEEPVKEEVEKDRFARDKELSKTYIDALNLSDGERFDYMNITKDRDLMVIVKETQDPKLSVKVGLGSEGKVLSRAEGLEALLGKSKLPGPFKACKFWLGTPIEVLELASGIKTLKVGVWCSLLKDMNAPPKSIELTMLFKVDGKVEDVGDLDPMWVGLSGRTDPIDASCTHIHSSSFKSPAEGVLEQTIKKEAIYVAAGTTADAPLDPLEDEKRRKKCLDSLKSEGEVVTHKTK